MKTLTNPYCDACHPECSEGTNIVKKRFFITQKL